MALVDNAIYVDGRRSADPSSLQETFELLRERHGIAWIGLYRPDVDEIRAVATEFKLHKLAVEDAITAHQRAKLERYKTTLFTVLRPARYLDDEERVELGELHVFTGTDFVVTSFRALLQNALTVHATLVGQRQNDEMRALTEASLLQNEEVKKISAWAAILFAPTLVGTIYGMNFTHMPELHWAAGYPLALALMLATSVTLYLVFKRRGWL
jgi:Mg2+ and Co2+ transporter CorA